METKEKDHFLRLMFFQASELSGVPRDRAGWTLGPADSFERRAATPDPAAGFSPLAPLHAAAGTRFRLPTAATSAVVRMDSPATEVMTDLSRVHAVTIAPAATVDAAQRVMVASGVRALFVVDDARQVVGLVTSTDLLGERPVQVARARGMRHDEIAVADAMTLRKSWRYSAFATCSRRGWGISSPP